jgi:DNA-binding transcriptional LysR family regulator
LVLTDAGKEYLTSCRRALRSLREGSELVERQRVNPSGLLRVAAPVCFAKNTLAPLLAGFLKAFPEMKVELDLYSSGWDFLLFADQIALSHFTRSSIEQLFQLHDASFKFVLMRLSEQRRCFGLR